MKKKTICVMGAGVTGMSIARLLADSHDVTIKEASQFFGGIARVKNRDGIPYHMIGGHCFNSKNKIVLDYVFNNIMPRDQWNIVERKAKIFFKDQLINYPIEFSLKEIFDFDSNLSLKMLQDLMSASRGENKNLKDWFVGTFGITLAQEYFIPYNNKIWGMDVGNMSSDWVATKLPIPNKLEVLRSFFEAQKDSMPHATFYYPKANSQEAFINNLSSGLNIRLNEPVLELAKENRGGWLVNGEYFDILINTIPLDLLGKLITDLPKEIGKAFSGLKYNEVTTMLWRSEIVDRTWTYDPSPESLFHRHIHIGSFLSPVRGYTITESVGERSEHEMRKAGAKFKYLLEPIDYNVSSHAYVVFDNERSTYLSKIMNYLDGLGLYTVGRFAEWEYYNMDVCIERAIKVSSQIKNNTV